MKKVLLFCLLGLVVVGCKDKREIVYEKQMRAVRTIFDVNGLDTEEEIRTGIGRNPTTKELSRLDFSNRKLTIIPPEIGLLTGLVKLDLSGNKIEELPPLPRGRGNQWKKIL